jgi:2-polyprenyl-3-methyl-5-hydroxy-6-metoxy-1,4-benzoquinol methylase
LARFRFAVRMALARFRREQNKCPYCRSSLHQRLARKWLLIEARKCAFCGLIFRYPTDDPRTAFVFYESEYRSGRVTLLPSATELRELRKSNFQGSIYDKSSRVELLKELYAGGKVLDFGCSWGYTVAQLNAAGMEAVGYELSQARAAFGRMALGVAIETDLATLVADNARAFSLIYADHVFEHVPDLFATFQACATLLQPGGQLAIMVPNCGGRRGREDGVSWGPFLGETHTISFTAEWFLGNLARHGFEVVRLGHAGRPIDTMPEEDELLCVVRWNGSRAPVNTQEIFHGGRTCADLPVA